MIKQLYARSTKKNFSKTKGELVIKTFRYEQPAFTIAKRLGVNNWTNIYLKNVLIDTIQLPIDFHYDDINISHDSQNDEDSDSKENPYLAKLLQTVIDEIIDKKNNADE